MQIPACQQPKSVTILLPIFGQFLLYPNHTFPGKGAVDVVWRRPISIYVSFPSPTFSIAKYVFHIGKCVRERWYQISDVLLDVTSSVLQKRSRSKGAFGLEVFWSQEFGSRGFGGEETVIWQEGERAAVRILNESNAALERTAPDARSALSKIRHSSS